jgi:hypothetical protein
MKMLKNGAYAIFESRVYKLGFNPEGRTSNLYSLDELEYSSIMGIDIEKVKLAYYVRTWLRCKGCDTIWEGNVKDLYLLGVRPSKDVDILGAKEVDRGVYMVEVDKSLIEGISEERIPLEGYTFPSNLETREEIPLSVLNS